MGDVDDGLRQRARTYPGVADNGTGCVFGRMRWEQRDRWMVALEAEMKDVVKKVDRLTWALALAAVSFAAAAVGLFINVM